MSIDVDFNNHSTNITYNVSPIYYRALRAGGIHGGLRGLDRMDMETALPKLKTALAFTEKYETRLKVHEPSNGWGSIQCVYRVFNMLIAAGEAGETGTIYIY